MLCCVLAWMNEYIVQIILATRLWLISRYSHHTLKKCKKMTAKNGHPCTKWFSSLYLQTNRKHMENQSLFCTQKTSFYRDNITSTLTIVVLSINWCECLPCMYVRCVANSNWKLWTTEKRQHRFGITGNVACVPIHAFALHSDTLFFQWSFARNLKNISPIVWYCCNIWRPYKLSNILYKTNEKAVSFLSATSGTSRDLSRVHSWTWLLITLIKSGHFDLFSLDWSKQTEYFLC